MRPVSWVIRAAISRADWQVSVPPIGSNGHAPIESATAYLPQNWNHALRIIDFGRESLSIKLYGDPLLQISFRIPSSALSPRYDCSHRSLGLHRRIRVALTSQDNNTRDVRVFIHRKLKIILEIRLCVPPFSPHRHNNQILIKIMSPILLFTNKSLFLMREDNKYKIKSFLPWYLR